MMPEDEKFKLVTIADKVKVQQSTNLFKESVAVVFKSKEPEKKAETQDLLNRYKQEEKLSTRTKRAAYKEAENRRLHRLLNRIQCHTNVKRLGIVLGSLAAWMSLLLAEQKDIATRVGHADASADAHRMRINAHRCASSAYCAKKKLPINCHFGLDSIAVSLFTNIRE